MLISMVESLQMVDPYLITWEYKSCSLLFKVSGHVRSADSCKFHMDVSARFWTGSLCCNLVSYMLIGVIIKKLEI